MTNPLLSKHLSATCITGNRGIPLASLEGMKNLMRRRPPMGTREREEARAFVTLAVRILESLSRRRERGCR